jgi:hypothetical protein
LVVASRRELPTTGVADDQMSRDTPEIRPVNHRCTTCRPTTIATMLVAWRQTNSKGDSHEIAYCRRPVDRGMPEAMSVDITAQAGAVKVEGLAGKLTVVTEAGAVEGRGLASDEVSVKTEAGAASLVFTQPPDMVHTTTSLGAVDLRLPGTTSYAVDIRTEVGSNSVDVDQDPASAHRITVRTEVGTVQIKRSS